jgi:acetoin utilization protein AcuB
MLVKDYMTRHPIMVPPTMPAADAQKIMVENRVRHLPVVGDGKRPLGLLTRERLRIPPADLGSLSVWEISRFLSKLSVKDIMVKSSDLLTTTPDSTLEEAAEIMSTHRIGCLPVIEDDVVVGIITETDMLLQLAEVLGVRYHGVRVVLRIPDQIGGYARIVSSISARGWGMYATAGVPAPKRDGYWDFVLKVRDVEKEDLLAALEQVGEAEVMDVRVI